MKNRLSKTVGPGTEPAENSRDLRYAGTLLQTDGDFRSVNQPPFSNIRIEIREALIICTAAATLFYTFARRGCEPIGEGIIIAWSTVGTGGGRHVVAAYGNIMLSVILDADRHYVSYGSTYADGTVRFAGLHKICEAGFDKFIDASIAMAGVDAFFRNARLSDHFDMRRGMPDSGICNFPHPMSVRQKKERTTINKSVTLSPEFRQNMTDVCEFLDEVEDDPDENIDFGDSIQIGAFCGGRTNNAAAAFEFSYYDASGEVWTFKLNRNLMDSIVDGGTTTMCVSASVPRAV